MGQALEAWKSCRAGRLVNGAEAGSGCGRPRRRLRGDNGSYSLGARGGATAQIAVAGRPRLDLRFIPAAALKASPTGADRDPHNGLIWSPFSGLVRENRGFQERGFVVPRSYAPEFRRRVVELVRLGRAVSVVAAEIGVSEATVYRWREQDRIDRGEQPGLSSVERVELAQARRRIRELETELEITKKASALFAEGEQRRKGSTR